MSLTARIADKAGALGSLVGGLACPACFPAIASLGAALGLGFLGRWEGVAVRVLIPICALVALAANLSGWVSHRQWRRAALGAVGPVLVLLGAFGLMGVVGVTRGFLPAGLARAAFYVGLVIMLVVALWNLWRPARACRIDATATRADARP
jgi:mercuric ion transport protein